jgi:hypothetical protein
MKSKERFLSALAHKQPDKVPMDFGSTAVTGMHVMCVAALREYYGLEKRPVKVIEPYQMLGEIEEDLIEAIGIDTCGVYPRNTIFGFPNEDWKEFKAPWGQELHVSNHFETSVDVNGDLLIYPEGDANAPPSGRMPTGGFFFDTIVRQEPIDDDKLDPDDNLEEFTPVSDLDLQYLAEQVKRAKATNRGVIANFGGTAFGDIALVPAPFLKHPKGIRDIEEWYISTAIRQDYVRKVFERQSEIALENLRKIFAVVGNEVDAVFICGTDFGTQTSSFCSTDTFDSLYAPYYRKINDWIHKNTDWKTFKHSCGAVESFMSHFVDAGFDIVNPVQCSAERMDPRKLKERYGEKLVFWGGGVDTQKTLPFGRPEDVRAEVLKRCEIFSPNGGFVFNAVHNVQADTPVVNIVAMIDAVREFNSAGGLRQRRIRLRRR